MMMRRIFVGHAVPGVSSKTDGMPVCCVPGLWLQGDSHVHSELHDGKLCARQACDLPGTVSQKMVPSRIVVLVIFSI